jgi:hypothetical protein
MCMHVQELRAGHQLLVQVTSCAGPLRAAGTARAVFKGHSRVPGSPQGVPRQRRSGL